MGERKQTSGKYFFKKSVKIRNLGGIILDFEVLFFSFETTNNVNIVRKITKQKNGIVDGKCITVTAGKMKVWKIRIFKRENISEYDLHCIDLIYISFYLFLQNLVAIVQFYHGFGECLCFSWIKKK